MIGALSPHLGGGPGRWVVVLGALAVLVPAAALLVHVPSSGAVAGAAVATAGPITGIRGGSASVARPAATSSVSASSTTSQAALSEMQPQVATESAAPVSPPISTTTVQAGDSLWSIALRFGTDVPSLEVANGLNQNSVIHPGQTLTVLNQVGWIWTVASGQSLSGIASSTGVSVSQLEKANDLGASPVLQPGQRLVIPEEPTAGQVEGTGSGSGSSSTARVWVVQSGDTLSGIASAEGVSLAVLESANGLSGSSILKIGEGITVPGGGGSGGGTPSRHVLLSWPVPTSYPITSPFGWRPNPWGPGEDFHYGIDIGVPLLTPVHAACSGKVTVASWVGGYRGGYGNAVEILCNLGPLTLYAHNTKLVVTVGEQVTRGQLISYSGSTGNSTGPHVHFGVQVTGNWENPLNYLPAR